MMPSGKRSKNASMLPLLALWQHHPLAQSCLQNWLQTMHPFVGLRAVQVEEDAG
jgi:cell division FtsZ-interacting protein ZapD